jgi:diguanylate cyclase (GGDEF)-like protein/PAS domain S-box-containing protein
MKPAIRISIGMVAVTTSLLFAADWALNIFPDPYAPALKERQDLSESLAIQYSSFVTSNRLPDMQLAMESVVDQMPDVLSMSLKKTNGDSIAETVEHSRLWVMPADGLSTPTQVLIPIYRGEAQWGVLQVKFVELPFSGFMGLLRTPLYKLIIVMAGFGFLAYMLYLSRTLRYLDPSSVVPSRVRAALDQLVEGVFILDDEQQIVLVNSSFAKQVGSSPDAMMGINPSGLPWVQNEDDEEQQELPWEAALRHGERKTDYRLLLQSPKDGVRVFMANVSPITDAAGMQRGVLASFNDISELERVNAGLKQTLHNLETAHDEVRQKNEELFHLATIDSLTGCLNRRAFFEKLELEFELAMRDGLKLSVVMADVDHFKKINDDFGHSVGDIVIKEMADTLSNSIGSSDFVGRYGGEEFCVVHVGTDWQDAISASNRARLAFENVYGSEQSVTKGRIVTASFGVSDVSFGADNVTDLLNQADLALYESKNTTRNCVTSWNGISTDRLKAS